MGTIATRRERVILDLDSNLAAGLARDAVAARALSGELDRLGGSTDRMGGSAGKAGPEIDRFSGRLRVFLDAALVLGPVLSPLGASIIPVLTGSIAALGAASGGIGAAILAFNGLGDAMKAIDEAQLEPTAENLQAMRIELEKLGPAGAEFAQFLQDLGPEMTQLQMVARKGMFPGMQEGIDDLLSRLPLVQDVISRLSKGVGDLAAEAGADLASDDWTPFLEYVRTTGRPTLERFGESIGNVANGLADMLVAFAPLTRDFSRGMLEMSESFADWAANLEDDQSFQDFVNYIRESGPQALELLGALADALVGILKAAAPIGSATLPILTALVKVIAALADSPLGSTFIAAAAGLTVFNRAAAVTGRLVPKLPTSLAAFNEAAYRAKDAGRMAAAGLGLVALSATDVDDKMGLSNTAMLAMMGMMGGPWGAAIGAGVGLTLDLAAANDSLKDSIDGADDAIARGSLEDMLKRRKELLDELADQHSAGPFFSDVGLDNFGDVFRGGINDITGASDDARSKIAELDAEIGDAGTGFDVLGSHIDTTTLSLIAASGAAQDFSESLSELAGWLDKDEALRNYHDGLNAIAKGLKDGFSREDVDNIAATGRNIIQVAESIKSPAVRARFLEGARASLEDLAKNAGPKARAEIQKLIDKIEEVGLTHAEPDIDVDTAKAVAKINNLLGLINVFDSKHPSVTLTTIYERINKPHGLGSATPGDTNQLFGGDPERGGGSDESPRIAVHGRTSGGQPYTITPRGGPPIENAGHRPPIDDAAHGTASALDLLRDRLHDSRAALEAETRQRDRLRQKAAEISSGIKSGLTGDLWATSEASGNVWGAGATAGGTMDPFAALAARKDQARRMIAAIRKLRRKGITGAALSEILTNGGLEGAEFMAAQPGSALTGFQADFAATQHLINQAAQAGVNASGFASDAAALTPEIRGLRRDVKHLEHALEVAIKNADKSNQAGHKGNKPKPNDFAANARRRAVRS